ncbi:MAG: Glycine cleavage H-protein, partial [Bacteroidota bacterium]|nr:Glycine cleavage H-protein [Bacteroidota bacterium]
SNPIRKKGKLCELTGDIGTKEVLSPVDGTGISSYNSAVLNDADIIIDYPYSSGWIVKISGVDPNGLTGLMTAQEYQNYINQ